MSCRIQPVSSEEVCLWLSRKEVATMRAAMMADRVIPTDAELASFLALDTLLDEAEQVMGPRVVLS